MKILILGASGATGKHLVEQLLILNQDLKIIVRSIEKLPNAWRSNPQITLIEGSISNLTKQQMANHLKDCKALASCLGHNPNLKGIYGKPRRLVTNAIRLACEAIEYNSPNEKIKVVLMNTVGNNNKNLDEKRSFTERLLLSTLRLLLPPMPDNEEAADYLRTKIGQNHRCIQWVAVRPDTLINKNEVHPYNIHLSPTTSLFKPNKSSRINVAHFMAQLITDESLWIKWKGLMPVIYDGLDL